MLTTLQLIRGKRNFSRTAVYAAPKPFLLVALISSGTPRLTLHLVYAPSRSSRPATDVVQNDQLFISHTHRNEDGLPNVEDLAPGETVTADDASTSSVVHTPPTGRTKGEKQGVIFSQEV